MSELRERVWKAIQKLGDTSSTYLSQELGCSSTKILDLVHELEEMHPGQIMTHNSGISLCSGDSKEDRDRFLLCSNRSLAILNRIEHINTHCLRPARKRIGHALLLKATPERRLHAIESCIDYVAEWRKIRDKDIVGSFDFDEDGKMRRYSSDARRAD
jgi:hypothetical protein